jgi:hypothetical protein
MLIGTIQVGDSKMHYKDVIGLICDAFDFGGIMQVEKAYQALAALSSEMQELRGAVKGGNGVDAPVVDLRLARHKRLLDIVEDGFDHPLSHLLGHADEALNKLRPLLDERKNFVSQGAKFPATI